MFRVLMGNSNPVGRACARPRCPEQGGAAAWVLDSEQRSPDPCKDSLDGWGQGAPAGVCYTHLPWSGVRCSMEDTFSRVLWSRSWASTLSNSTMERFMCQAKLPGRSISSTGIRQMPCGMERRVSGKVGCSWSCHGARRGFAQPPPHSPHPCKWHERMHELPCTRSLRNDCTAHVRVICPCGSTPADQMQPLGEAHCPLVCTGADSAMSQFWEVN